MRAFGTGTKAWLLGRRSCSVVRLIVDSAQAAQTGDDTLKPTAVLPSARDRHPHDAAMAHIAGHAFRQRVRAGTRAFRHFLRSLCAAGVRHQGRRQCVAMVEQRRGSLCAGRPAGNRQRAEFPLKRPDAARSCCCRETGGERPRGHRRSCKLAKRRQSAARISRNVAVVDVSEANNWSAVRVELGRDGTFGSVYPTYGFIYNRPDTGSW